MSATIVPRFKSVTVLSLLSEIPSSMEILHEIYEFLDKKSKKVIEFLKERNLILSSKYSVKSIEIFEFEKDLSFMEVFEILSQENIVSADVESVLEMLYLLKGEENKKNRETFFKGGLILLSLDAILIDGEIQYLMIGENSAEEKNMGQYPFSLRLVSLPDIFSHSFYRLITVKEF